MKNGEIVRNELLRGDYYRVDFHVPEVCKGAKAGQFVHVRIDEGSERILRRPFSIHDVNAEGILTVIYKVVGNGTERLAKLKPGAVCDLMGPLGTSFTPPKKGELPILVVGGYGAAATYMIAKHAKAPGIVLLGARSREDVLLVDRYEEAGFEVRIATNDGSTGKRGFVTELLPDALADAGDRKPVIYGCGPHPMLMALAGTMQEHKIAGELSLDHLMCCGIGACFACVVKIKSAETPEGWCYLRSCSEGPVFDAQRIYTE